MTNKKNINQSQGPGWRYNTVAAFLAGFCFIVFARLIQLHAMDGEFLNSEGEKRTLREEVINAHRGQILDRNGQVLAVSTPVASVWINPNHVSIEEQKLRDLAGYLEVDLKTLIGKFKQTDKSFVYLKRQVSPHIAKAIDNLEIDGLHLEREYKRYYPASEVAAHVVGFTDVDDQGLEGIELALDDWLSGEPGARRVVKDRRGAVVKDLGVVQSAVPGRDVVLSIDLRLQYLAYRELAAEVERQGASSGSVVMLDAKTGEVLALANQPSYNPNNRSNIKPEFVRNRAITDLYEPGSTVKPLTIASAIGNGVVDLTTEIDTSPGFIHLGTSTLRDTRNYGVLDVRHIIKKSSNVGAVKVAQQLGGESLWKTFQLAGFGSSTGTGFPGEANGMLPPYSRWKGVNLATLSYGYGLAATPLQIAQAYLPFANHGYRQPVSLLKKSEQDRSIKVMAPEVADTVLDMMESVVETGGTGTRASVKGYRVAGKTGTVHKVGKGGYDDSRYVSGFAGIAPATDPQIVAVVLIDDPKGEEYYGGEIAAPVFSNLISESMRIMNVNPDEIADYKSLDDELLKQAEGEAYVAN